MTIILFGQLTDITGSNTITVNGVADTDSLVKEVNKLFPSMINVKYRIAVNKKIISDNTEITESSNIALLPPFSGG